MTPIGTKLNRLPPIKLDYLTWGVYCELIENIHDQLHESWVYNILTPIIIYKKEKQHENTQSNH